VGVEAALTTGIPIVRFVDVRFIIAIAIGNENSGRFGDAPRALDVQSPITQGPSVTSARRHLLHFSKMDPKKIRRSPDATQRKPHEMCKNLLYFGLIHGR
jgi:hypothetical protein